MVSFPIVKCAGQMSVVSSHCPVCGHDRYDVYPVWQAEILSQSLSFYEGQILAPEYIKDANDRCIKWVWMTNRQP